MRRTSVTRKALLVVGVLLASTLPVSPAWAAEQIRFLNPSGYTTPVVISDKLDVDSTVHLVAWVQDVPDNPLVEFEIQAATGNPVTVDGTRVSNDTWEADLSVASLTDGQYTLRARLYAGFTGPGTGTEVATTERSVTLNRSDIPPPAAADTVEITSPVNGGALPYFTPKSRPTNTLLRVITSEGTQQVRAFYTTSAPGTEPSWNFCGFGRVTDELATVRCTLAAGTSGAQVTAVAAVANSTPPPAEPSAVGDATGDAHRVVPVAQVPTSVEITPASVTADLSKCQAMAATVRDQAGRFIAGVNVDVHTTGPDDQIRYGTIGNNVTSPFQAPDTGHVSTRAARNCADGENQNTQGDHNIPGADDPQHIESTTGANPNQGTNNDGKFTFALYSDTAGTSDVVAYADVNDDDALGATEASGGGQIGWGGPPAPATPAVVLEPRSTTATAGSCERFVLGARQGGTALVNVNVDVHISGPSAGVSFCLPSGGSSTRAPDQGSHIGNADSETTKHIEGETDASGNLVFGVTSPDVGSTQVVAWLDSSDNDIQESGEPSQTGAIEWTVASSRSISIQTNKGTVATGRFVTITGRIDGSEACTGQQLVRLKAKRPSAARFVTVKSTSTDDQGDYLFRIRVKRTKKYRTLAPSSGVCNRAISRTITVRAV